MRVKKFPAIWLPCFLFFLFIAASPGRVVAFDVAIRAEIAHALWSTGSVFVPPGSPVDAGLLSTPRGGTSFYGIGQTLVFIPFDALGHWLAGFTRNPEWAHQLNYLPLALFYPPILGVLWWFALSLLLTTLGVDAKRARWAAVVFSTATIAFVYSTQSVQEESLVGCLSIFALHFWIQALRNYRPRSAFWAGALAASCLLVRLNSVWILLPLLGAALDFFPRGSMRSFFRMTGWAAAGASPVLLTMGFFAWWRFGSFFSTGYSLAAAQGMGVFWTSFQWPVFWGLLFGAGKGLFVLSPFFLFLFVGLSDGWKKYPALSATVLSSWVGSAVLCACIYNNPDGSESWGARYQVHLLGFGFYLAWYGWEKLRDAAPRMAFAAVFLCASLQCFSLVAPDAVEYTQNDDAGLSRLEILNSVPHGQLGRRVTNTAVWLSGQTLQSPHTAAMEHLFVPNLWGFSWAKKAGPVSGSLFFLAWCACLAAALLCFANAVQHKKSR